MTPTQKAIEALRARIERRTARILSMKPYQRGITDLRLKQKMDRHELMRLELLG